MIKKAIRGPIVLWVGMLGVYLAVKFSPIPEEIVEVVGKTLKALWIFSVAWVSAGTVSMLITAYAVRRQVAVIMTSLAQQLAKLGILGLGLLIILDSLGIKIGSLLAALGIGSLGVALGLQDTLSNLFAGMYVGVSKNLRLGDYVKLQSGEEGYITDIGWRETKIRMLPNNVVVIPNAKLSQSVITNYHLPDKELAVLVEVGAAYDSDLERVERVTVEVGKEVLQTVPGGIASFEPMVRFHTFGESSINFTVVLRAKEFVDQYLIKHEFIKRLRSRYVQEGIVIPFPIRTVHLTSKE
ncbi:MAG: mechanosensitive ion channel family protein [Candidatus Omnitrophica bacterium]|nr:mechanosensitive ion channel family protein [Candidatus Omnitrophota bacterium]